MLELSTLVHSNSHEIHKALSLVVLIVLNRELSFTRGPAGCGLIVKIALYIFRPVTLVF